MGQDVGSADRLRADVASLATTARHRTEPGDVAESRAYVERALFEAEWVVEHRAFRLRPGFRTNDDGGHRRFWTLALHGSIDGCNLIATRAGQARPGALLLAHLDTVGHSPGADDNASAIAVLLEVARRLGPGIDVTIAVVDLEELGVAGSTVLARTMRPLPDAVIALDCVGFFDDRPGIQKVPPGWPIVFRGAARDLAGRDRRGDFVLAVHRADSQLLAQSWAAAAAELGLATVSIADRRWIGRGQNVLRWTDPIGMHLDRSDHSPFWRRGVPGLFLTDTGPYRSPHYHKPSDVPATLDYERLAAVSAALLQVLDSGPVTANPVAPLRRVGQLAYHAAYIGAFVFVTLVLAVLAAAIALLVTR